MLCVQRFKASGSKFQRFNVSGSAKGTGLGMNNKDFWNNGINEQLNNRVFELRSLESEAFFC